MLDAAAAIDSPTLSKHADQWLLRFRENLDAALAAGDADSVHGLRVASRRLGETLLLMQAAAGRRAVRRARRGLKRIRDAFDVTRDIDVLSLSLHAPQRAAAWEADALALLDAEIEARRAAFLENARKLCARVRPEKLAARIETTIHAAAEAPQKAESLRTALCAMLDKRAAAVLESDPRRSPTAEVHKARIAVKRLRYCAELCAKMAPSWDAALITRLTEFQRLLGEWNDHAVAAQWIGGLASKRRNLARRTAWSARLLEYAAARGRLAGELRGAILEKWPELEAAIHAAQAARPAAENSATATDAASASA